MGYTRVAFAAGVAVGFVAGTRAGREQYDRIVKYSRKVVTSPQVQQAGRTISAKATEMAKSASAKAPKAASGAAKKARERAGKMNMPKSAKMPKVSARLGRSGSRSASTNPDAPQSATQPSVNGRKAAQYND
jgi:hypothetical protein